MKLTKLVMPSNNITSINISSIKGFESKAVKPVSEEQIDVKLKYFKAGTFKINGTKIRFHKSDTLSNIKDKLNRHPQLKAEIVKKEGKYKLILNSFVSTLRIDDIDGVLKDLNDAGMIGTNDKNLIQAKSAKGKTISIFYNFKPQLQTKLLLSVTPDLIDILHKPIIEDEEAIRVMIGSLHKSKDVAEDINDVEPTIDDIEEPVLKNILSHTQSKPQKANRSMESDLNKVEIELDLSFPFEGYLNSAWGLATKVYRGARKVINDHWG